MTQKVKRFKQGSGVKSGSLIPNAIPTTLIIDKDGKVAVRISGEVTVAGLKKMLDKVLAND